jgi:hypothetical protein
MMRAAIFALASGIAVLSLTSAAARDVKLDDQAWACSTLYSRQPIKVANGGDRKMALCLGEGKKGRKPMSRAEAFELCREQFDATSLLLNWTSKGWRCRFYGR